MSEEMTNKQAMEILEAARKTMYLPKSGKYISDMGYALEKGIAALEAEPCDDAIRRQAVDTLVDELARAISDERCCISRGRSTATIMQDILDLPSVTPKQRTGHWIDVKPYGGCECSLCGCLEAGYSDFCPDCGAKMVEPQESEVLA